MGSIADGTTVIRSAGKNPIASGLAWLLTKLRSFQSMAGDR